MLIRGGGGGQQQQQASTEGDLAAAGRHGDGGGNSNSNAAAVATSRQWSAQTESRIVRVSRVFGGKDRHSKVKTVKGLRDRRVRLSVPTAIQLYDLQDRLGLNQPSKVVDWLLNAARHEIDKLPPLQFPPHAHDLMGHVLPSSVPLMHDEKFGGHISAVATLAADGCVKAAAGAGGDDGIGRFPAGGYHRFMGLNNTLGMVSTAMPYSYAGESWNNSGVHEGGAGSPQVAAAAAHHSPFPSLLSLAPGSHQLAFYSEAEPFQVDSLGSQSLTLSSATARAFHDHQTGS